MTSPELRERIAKIVNQVAFGRAAWDEPSQLSYRVASAISDELVLTRASTVGMEAREKALREEIWCLREVVRGVRVMNNAGRFKEFEGEPWLKRVTNIDLDYDPCSTLASEKEGGKDEGETKMKIVIEKGQHNWYASTEECDGLYRGLLVVGGSMDAVVDKLPEAFADLRKAAASPASLIAKEIKS